MLRRRHGGLYVWDHESVEFWIILALALKDDSVRRVDAVELWWPVDFGGLLDFQLDFSRLVLQFVCVVLWEYWFVVFVLIKVLRLKGPDSFGLNPLEKPDNFAGSWVIIEVFYGLPLVELEGVLKGFKTMGVDLFELEKSLCVGFPWHEYLFEEAWGSFDVLDVVLYVTDLDLVRLG